ncbi:hypothetical protein CLM82_02450, partial [Streptomyces albidoflavus]
MSAPATSAETLLRYRARGRREDITALGDGELERLDFRPLEPGATDEMRGDYERGLDAYENAK